MPDEEIARCRRTLVSEIIIEPQYESALTGIEAYSHLIVLFWMGRTPPFENVLLHPSAEASAPRVGAFAMRRRNRPNPIGLAVVDLIQRVNNRLIVRRLDAYDQSPIIDIKPYDHYDTFTQLRVPAWSNSAPRTP